MNPSPDPAAVLNLSRAPRGEIAAAQLVAAVARVGDLAERHYLELKGPPDFEGKANKQKVAKFILGAANRMPSRAAEAFEGFGVMLVGITKDGALGVPPIETLSLSQVIKPFLGEIGPHWDIVRVPVEGSTNQVVVILVDPPEIGQAPFICRSSGDGLVDGRIYYRADGETREPTSDELDQLMARGATAPPAPVELIVSVVGRVTPAEVDEVTTLETYIQRTRKRLLDAMPGPKPPESPERDYTLGQEQPAFASRQAEATFLASLSEVTSPRLELLLGTDEPENRTEAEYIAQIDQWEGRFRNAWPTAVELFIAHAVPANEIRVINQTRTFLHDVVVEVHLEGAVESVEWEYASEGGPDWGDVKLPRPPRKWGPTKRVPPFGFGSEPYWSAMPAAIPNYSSMRTYTPPSTSWKNGGSVDIRIDVGDLRPEATFESEDVSSILVIRGEVPASVRGTWRATALGYNEIFTGTLEGDVGEVGELTDQLRKFLELG